MVCVKAHVTPTTRKRVEELARGEGISISSYLRRLYTNHAISKGWKQDKHNSGGFVYLIRCCGSYKIGRTKSRVEQRVFGMSLPAKPEIVCTAFTNRYEELEKEMHHRFAHRRGYGEWFDLTKQEVEEAIKQLQK